MNICQRRECAEKQNIKPLRQIKVCKILLGIESFAPYRFRFHFSHIFPLFLNPQAGLRKGRVFPPCRKVITGTEAVQTLSGARHSPPPPSILSVAEARAVPAEAMRRSPRLTAYFAIALLAGLRPSATNRSQDEHDEQGGERIGIIGRNTIRSLAVLHIHSSQGFVSAGNKKRNHATPGDCAAFGVRDFR